jgi:hypothetical protein
MSGNDKLLEVLLEEVRELRSDIKDMRHEVFLEIHKTSKDISTLKFRFMAVAITMGLAGGKVSALIPFLK